MDLDLSLDIWWKSWSYLFFQKFGKKCKQWNVWQIYQHNENFDAVARTRGPESLIFWPYLLRSILIDCFLLCINSEQMMLFREIPFLYKGFTCTNGIFSMKQYYLASNVFKTIQNAIQPKKLDLDLLVFFLRTGINLIYFFCFSIDTNNSKCKNKRKTMFSHK